MLETTEHLLAFDVLKIVAYLNTCERRRKSRVWQGWNSKMGGLLTGVTNYYRGDRICCKEGNAFWDQVMCSHLLSELCSCHFNVKMSEERHNKWNILFGFL